MNENSSEFMRSNRAGNMFTKSATRGSISVKPIVHHGKSVETDKHVPLHTHMMTIICPPASSSDKFKGKSDKNGPLLKVGEFYKDIRARMGGGWIVNVLNLIWGKRL